MFDNFWSLVERWKVTYVITVPTALSVLMQRPVNADVSSLRGAFSGSAPLPIELYNRFEKATGVKIIEGYGLTECTCLVAVNPPEGEKKIGSVGIPFPYTSVRILHCGTDGAVTKECGPDEVGEICVANPGVFPGSTYTEVDKNRLLFAEGRYLRTGDLGRLDADGYLFITGRAKDLIIRGGHNIDPAEIEEAMMRHEAIAGVAAIGQPDSFAGELPCAYVELVKGRTVTTESCWTLRAPISTSAPQFRSISRSWPNCPRPPWVRSSSPICADWPSPASMTLRWRAPGLDAKVVAVVEDKKRGLVAKLGRGAQANEEAVRKVLGEFAIAWDWAD